MTKPQNGKVPFDSSNPEVIWTTAVGLWLLFLTPYCSFPRLSLHHTACHSWLTPNPSGNLYAIPRVRLVRVGPHLTSRFITRSEMSLPTASAAAPPLRNECNAISSGLRRDSVTTSLTAWRARPYLTTLTGLPNGTYLTTLKEQPNRYVARGA